MLQCSAKDIANLKIISKEEAAASVKETETKSKVLVKRPIAKRASRSVSESTATVSQSATSQVQVHPKKLTEPTSVKMEPPLNGKMNAETNAKPNQKRISQRQRWQDRDEQAFGTPIDQSLNQDFDFETNLALFNKEVC